MYMYVYTCVCSMYFHFISGSCVYVGENGAKGDDDLLDDWLNDLNSAYPSKKVSLTVMYCAMIITVHI